jgi:hypothetical protein
MVFNRVVLEEPEGPMTATSPFFGKVPLTLCRISFWGTFFPSKNDGKWRLRPATAGTRTEMLWKETNGIFVVLVFWDYCFLVFVSWFIVKRNDSVLIMDLEYKGRIDVNRIPIWDSFSAQVLMMFFEKKKKKKSKVLPK